MKIKLLSIVTILGLATLQPHSVCGKDGQGSDDGTGHHQGETNEIEGVGVFRGHVVLTPTAAAPTGVRGFAELEQENEHGAVFYKAEVRTFGLPAGTYPVTATLSADGSTISLGDLVTTTSSGRADLLLPVGVSVVDLAQIIVSDSTGAVLLAGDVAGTTPGTSATFTSNVKISAGVGAPQATGKAQIKVSERRGQISQRFTLAASRLPANATFNVLANGAQVATVTSNKRGSLSIRELNAELLTLKSVSLVSASDLSEALSAHF